MNLQNWLLICALDARGFSSALSCPVILVHSCKMHTLKNYSVIPTYSENILLLWQFMPGYFWLVQVTV